MNFDFKRMLKFEHNVGEKEKKYRLYAGSALLVISLFVPGGEVLLLLVGLVLVATGYSGWCPVYSGLNKNTCEAAGTTESAPTPTESDSSES
ncbi:MAG: YgaP family membrane protein [Methylobacter sp.]